MPENNVPTIAELKKRADYYSREWPIRAGGDAADDRAMRLPRSA
jgi:hypothetical protein